MRLTGKRRSLPTIGKDISAGGGKAYPSKGAGFGSADEPTATGVAKLAAAPNFRKPRRPRFLGSIIGDSISSNTCLSIASSYDTSDRPRCDGHALRPAK